MKQISRNNLGSDIKRSNLIWFEFDGLRLSGYQGDTLASALLANNIHFVARSLKFHRPRGILSAGLEEPSALVECANPNGVFIPNLKITEVMLRDGLITKSQNNWPTLHWDISGVLFLFVRLMRVGFYYKTFKWPAWGWHYVYEKIIRRFAGHGRIRCDNATDLFDQRNKFCQLLIIGSGPAGLSAALTAVREGVEVVVIEQDAQFGGSLRWRKEEIDGLAPLHWLKNTLRELNQFNNFTLLPRTLGFGQYDHGMVLASQYLHNDEDLPGKLSGIFWKIRAEKIILATGAIEKPKVFVNNDLPGIMLASAVRQYIYRFGVSPGKKAFLAIDDADERTSTKVALCRAGIEIAGSLKCGEKILNIKGRKHVNTVIYSSFEDKPVEVSCDLICVSSGWMPSAHLAAHKGGKFDYDEAFQSLVVPMQIGSMLLAGACRGIFSNRLSAVDGKSQAKQALAQLGLGHVGEEVNTEYRTDPNQEYEIHIGNDKAFVDLQNDVTRADIHQAIEEGFDDVELLKRYSTVGMGTDQGKTSWTNAISEISTCNFESDIDIRHTTFRPPYSPIRFGMLSGAKTGQDLTPVRRTPLHSALESMNCVFQTSGEWLYPRYFPKNNESMEETIIREVKCVRNGVGFVDMSTLGKIEVKGKDALDFLSRVYCNNISQIGVGRIRYGLMLREDGIVYDDGTIARLGEFHFLITTTTSNAQSVWLWLTKLLQTQWFGLDVFLTSVSDQWASVAIAGPQSRNLLSKLECSFDIDQKSLPFASVREGSIDGGIPCRVFTVSFSGELSYEINVPSGYANHLVCLLETAGLEFDLTPYGLETLDVLRIEKGHISIGTEVNGRTTPADLGLEKMVSTKKDFIGRSLLMRKGFQSQYRQQLVGLTSVDNKTKIPCGGHVVALPLSESRFQKSQGKLTAAVYSPTVERPIALAFLDNGFVRMGEKLWVVSPVFNESVEVVVGPSCVYDSDGERLHG